MARIRTEELRRLHDPDARIIEVRQRLSEKIAPRHKVSVEDDEVLASGAFEGIPQVARLLHPAAVLANHVHEPETVRQLPSAWVVLVIEHEGGRIAGVRPK